MKGTRIAWAIALCLVLAVGLWACGGGGDSGGGKTITGYWGVTILQYFPIGNWWSSYSGLVTMYSDNTGRWDYKSNTQGTPSAGVMDLAFSYHNNSNGSTNTTITKTDGTYTTYTDIMEDDNNIKLRDGTEYLNNGSYSSNYNRMQIISRVSSNAHTISDLSGNYYCISYGYNSSSGPRSSSCVLNFDGSGNFSYVYYSNDNGIIANNTSVGACTIANNGKMTCGGILEGYYSKSTGTVSLTTPSSTNTWDDYFVMKKGDRVYSTSDLSGSWGMTIYGDNNGTKYSGFGTATCTAAGNCTIKYKLNSSGTVVYSQLGTQTFSAASDGSISMDGVPYAGAIGNNGNTVILNNSFNASSNRQIIIAVRCSSCTDISTGPQF